jgi:polygalacturonase
LASITTAFKIRDVQKMRELQQRKGNFVNLVEARTDRDRAEEEERFGGKVCNILDYGAVEGSENDNAMDNQKALHTASDDCGKTPGSTVLISGGSYISGPVYFTQNDITWHIDADATLIATDIFSYYKPKDISGDLDAKALRGGELTAAFENVFTFVSKNGKLEGLGTVDGRGLKWWEAKGNLSAKAPFLFEFQKCENFVLKDIITFNSPHIFFHVGKSKNFTVINVKTEGPEDAANTASFGVASTEDFYMTGCDLASGDDCVTVVRTSKNCLVENSTFRYCHGLSLGTDIEHVINTVFRNLKIIGAVNGARIKSKKGAGGFVQNITFSDIEMWETDYPIIITLNENKLLNNKNNSDDENSSKAGPDVKDVFFRNIYSHSSLHAGYFECIEGAVCTGFVAHNITIANFDKELYCDGTIIGTATDVSPPFTPCWQMGGAL